MTTFFYERMYTLTYSKPSPLTLHSPTPNLVR